MIVTRWNPTTNGNLHLGHAYSLIVNERFAHENGGKLIIRFDDDSPVAAVLPDDRRARIIANQKSDINWLLGGQVVDEWQWQSKLHSEVISNLELVGHETIKDVPEGETWIGSPARQMSKFILRENKLKKLLGDE